MKKIPLIWFKSSNFGDALNVFLVEKISGKKIKEARFSTLERIKSFFNIGKNYLVIGSILSYARKNSIIWGAGFLLKENNLKDIPKKIYAVRGPLTRKKLLLQGINCPQVYGDPALLLPKFYNPKIKKKYKLGIIPHYIEGNIPLLKKFAENKEVKIINITSDIKKVVKEILSCEKIASSSLHGIIVSDAYKIPSIWIKFSDKVIGEGFKFRDYFMSVKRKDRRPLIIKDETKLKNIYDRFYDYKIKIDLNKLLDVCPFKNLKRGIS